MTAFQFTGFAPDADPTTPGVLTDCSMMIPSIRGMVAAPRASAPFTQTIGALSSPISGHFFYPGEVGTAYAYMVSGGKIFTLTSEPKVGWTNVTPTGAGGFYTGGYPMSMGQFGPNIVLAVGSAGGDLMIQQTAAASAFTRVTTAPSANVLVICQRFVVLLGHTTAGSTSGFVADGWYCCARDDHTNWTPNVSTLCGFGRVPDEFGGWNAGVEFGNVIYAFKARAFYRGDFVGAQDGIWKFTKLRDVGCMHTAGVTKTDKGIVFLSLDNLYMFDGANLVGLMDGKIRDWFVAKYAPYASADSTNVCYDRKRNCIWLRFPDSIGTHYLLVYNLATGAWGRVEDTEYYALVEAPDSFYDGAVTSVCGFHKSDWKLYSLSGTYNASGSRPVPSLTTWDIGDDTVATAITDTRLRFTTAPTTATCIPYTRENLGSSLTTGSTATRTADGKFELRNNAPSARWQRHKYAFDTHCEVTHLSLPNVKNAGDRK